ncbi:urease accessory protein UreD [Allonocardiopsis opalescens]|uniref:Urease accessory protein UreD n=1 Tax=Allonocardiopsis opalescens TaxID=1144618 RepID=A0A2T0Q4W5_9ACTN|nr:urease accessory protein UreD [Allonocardiopsis opalescens]PRX98855.1 urease accessory protein [Allonocardiopsis opalescens]
MTGLEARAAVVAESDGAGGTRFPVLRGGGPLALRATGGGRIHLVGAAAGPLHGDDLRLDCQVRPGAALRLRSAAAMLVLSGASRYDVAAEVAEDGLLDHRPEPVIVTRGAAHRAHARVRLRPGARLDWTERVVLGRHGEEPGGHRSRLDVVRGGVPLLRHELRLGPHEPHAGPAVLDDARAVGLLLLAGPEYAAAPVPVHAEPGLAVTPLAGPGVLVTALAPDAAALDALLARGRARAER